jgi:hypothetical protein
MSAILNHDERQLLMNFLKPDLSDGDFHFSFKRSDSAMDWYKLTENARHVLNQIVSASIAEQYQEMKLEYPNQQRIEVLQEIAGKIVQAARDSSNFQSKERMIEIIEEFSHQ